MNIISDTEIAESLQKAIQNRQPHTSYISMTNTVINGVRYIEFTAMSNAEFRRSYTFLTMLSDILAMDDRKETWANPHFYDDWEVIRPFVMDVVDADYTMPIILSGHGVGGAIAVIAGYHLTMLHRSLFRVVTFGAPAALNSKKVKHGLLYPLQQMTTQYVLPVDPMPKLFRWTKYQSAARTVLNVITDGGEIDNYVDALKVVRVFES